MVNGKPKMRRSLKMHMMISNSSFVFIFLKLFFFLIVGCTPDMLILWENWLIIFILFTILLKSKIFNATIANKSINKIMNINDWKYLFSLLLGATFLRERKRLVAVSRNTIFILIEDSSDFRDVNGMVFIDVLYSWFRNLRQFDSSAANIQQLQGKQK